MAYNPAVWFEIYVEDMDRAVQFYQNILGVELSKLESPMENMEMMAFPMDMAAPGASGALVRMDGFSPGGGGTIVYFHSPDCAVEAARVEAAGGKLQMPKTSIGMYGFIMLGVDTEGNFFGVHTPADQQM